MPKLILDTIAEEPAKEKRRERVASEDSDSSNHCSLYDNEKGGKLKRKKKRKHKRETKPKEFQELYDDLVEKHPYHKYVAEFAEKTEDWSPTPDTQK